MEPPWAAPRRNEELGSRLTPIERPFYIFVVIPPDRRAARQRMTARVFRLGDEPSDDLSSVTTAAQRIDIVAELSRRMWELTGRPTPSYSRATMPGRVVRPK